MAMRLGLDCSLKHGTAGTTAATAFTDVIAVTLNLANEKADATTRSSGGFKQSSLTLTDATLTIEMKRTGTPNAGYDALRAACLAKTAIALLALDGTAVDSQGLDADWVVESMSRPEPLADGVKVTFTCSLAESSRAPSWTDLAS